jgi:DNA-binding CsgD family transcriptional regulator
MVLAIGLPCFPNALIGALREVANVGHCMVFAFEEEQSARWAIVARHCQAEQAEDVADSTKKLERLFATTDRFAALTPPEKEVCLRILSGHSSQAISAELGVSLHSTLTYRKRAYEKIGISSQNELFGIVLGLMALPRRTH